MKKQATGTIYKKSIFSIFSNAKNLGLLLAPIFLLLNSIRITIYKMIHSRTPIIKEIDGNLKKKFDEYFNDYWRSKRPLLVDDYYENISKSYNISSVFTEEDYSLYFRRANREEITEYIKNGVFLKMCYQKFFSKELCLKEKDKLKIIILSAEHDFDDIYTFTPGRFYELFFIFSSNESNYVYYVLTDPNFYRELKNYFAEKFPYYKISGTYLN